MPFRPRLNEQQLVGRLHGVGEGAPGAVEAVPVLGEAGEVLDGEGEVAGEDLLAADAQWAAGGGGGGSAALHHRLAHRVGDEFRAKYTAPGLLPNTV